LEQHSFDFLMWVLRVLWFFFFF